jgi:CubicO group peptidase (beta-lactamase class C family)
MSDRAWTEGGLAHVDEVLTAHTGRGRVPGAAWLVAHHGEVHTGVAGSLHGDGPPVTPDTIFRISSMSKPIVAVAALQLVEACVLRLDDPVERWLPELADRQVLVDPRRSIEETVPAARPISVHDVLTSRMGWGMDFEHWDAQPLLGAMADALGMPVGPPQPQLAPAPDEWMARAGRFPLETQPGERWLYNTAVDVLGVLVARAADRPLDEVLRERVFEPLGMTSTGFWVPEEQRDRFTTAFLADGAVFDRPDGQWASPPAFPSAAGGLVSTVEDYGRFALALLGGGSPLVSRSTVAAMTTDQLVAADGSLQGGPDPTGAAGWGLGVGVQRRRIALLPSAGSYGWTGGLGSSWSNDPAEDLAAVLLTNQAFSSPALPPICQDLWSALATALP